MKWNPSVSGSLLRFVYMCMCIMCEVWVYGAQIEGLNRNNTGSYFSVNPRLLYAWLSPTWIAEEVHVNSMADLTAAQLWSVWSLDAVEQKWWCFSVSGDLSLCRGSGGTKGACFPPRCWDGHQPWGSGAIASCPAGVWCFPSTSAAPEGKYALFTPTEILVRPGEQSAPACTAAAGAIWG